MLGLLLCLMNPALAEDLREPTRVFVSEFQASSKEAESLAVLLSGFLSSQLGDHPDLVSIPASAAPDFGEYSARVYLLSCPPGEYLGCAFVVGDRVEARYAIAGTVATTTSGSVVHVTIIDVWNSREALAFDAELGLGDDQAFAEGVAQILVAVIEGREGRHDDIREFDDPELEAQARADAELASRQLAALAAEIGDVTTLTSRGGGAIDRPEYTLGDLELESRTDARPAWEMLGMTPGEYIKYKNSGLTVLQWRDLAAGRRHQVVVRMGGLVSLGPWSSTYEGWYAQDSTTGEVMEAKAWQARSASSGSGGTAWVGFGVHPLLEVDLGLGAVSGRYYMHIQQEIVGDEPIVRDGVDFGAPNFLVGARVIGAPLPTHTLRPQLGIGALYVIGEGNERNQIPASATTLPSFAGNHLLLIQVLPGAEVSLSDTLDLYLVVPLSAVIAGQPQRTWSGEAKTPGALQTYQDPAAAPIFSAGAEAGFAVRLGGGPKPMPRFDDLDEPE
ncbi:MAG TPA: hypothetical protein QGF58_02955 [Myxococcota bacterium]|nr:hypothetical protein [Myxococcota bacterium]